MEPAGGKEACIAILFADVVDSSRLFTTYGDAEARRIIGTCLQAMCDVTAANGGRVVKTIGDEILCAFPDGDRAGLAGTQMHSRLAEGIKAGEFHNTLHLRIGLHCGPAVEEASGDIFGDAVNVAARMASLSKSDQILTTLQTVEAMVGAMRPLARYVDRSPVKGQVGEFDLYEIVWNAAEVTLAGAGAAPRVLDATVRLLDVRRGDRVWTVSAERPELTMGRGGQCDVVVEDTLASRLHAKIVYGKDRFILHDVSTNGTFVQLEEGGARQVRRDEHSLTSNGLLMLGRAVEPESPACLRLTLRREVPRL